MEHIKTDEELKNELIEQYKKLNPIGDLFNTIKYASYEDLDKFIVDLTPEQSLYCIIEAVKYAYGKGVFKLEESETISKAIRIINNK
jgi:hypothetical protein